MKEIEYSRLDAGESQSYATRRKKDIKRIKELLKNPYAKIEYYNNWIKINGETFNGFTKEFIEKCCNVATSMI